MSSLMQHTPVLDLYLDIANITTAMLTAAQSDDWDTVLVCGQQYCETVERLRDVEPGQPLDEAGRTLKHDLLVRILENDAAVRDLALPQLARLGTLLGRMKRQQSVLAAYRGQAAGA
ncbi:flagellar protein FliT [Bordetella genomosp. 13]|uniref:flagellar protein FliT n=1 Tax=Bordetella genomosp. 13 TaxID=463040 RepID=UPI0011A3017C|nr:flagellar protein FliT [Bordetella genomosp. 13]